MSAITIVAVCKVGHSQTIKLPPEWGKERAERLARLLEPFDLPPALLSESGSIIGRCGICGEPISCTVAEAVAS